MGYAIYKTGITKRINIPLEDIRDGGVRFCRHGELPTLQHIYTGSKKKYAGINAFCSQGCFCSDGTIFSIIEKWNDIQRRMSENLIILENEIWPCTPNEYINMVEEENPDCCLVSLNEYGLMYEGQALENGFHPRFVVPLDEIKGQYEITRDAKLLLPWLKYGISNLTKDDAEANQAGDTRTETDSSSTEEPGN